MLIFKDIFVDMIGNIYPLNVGKYCRGWFMT